MYFLIVGFIMAIGYYTYAFESAISPWTTLGPLAVVIAFSLMVEGSADLKRHRNDAETNNSPCTILTRTDDLSETAKRDASIIRGRDCLVNVNKDFIMRMSTPEEKKVQHQNVKVAFQEIPRMDIRQGHFVVVKNREMVPADMVLMASSNDGGSAYIETSSIDGETNLKLRISPTLPKNVLRHLRDGTPLDSINEDGEDSEKEEERKYENIEDATKRLTRISYLGRPRGKSALLHPDYAHTKVADEEVEEEPKSSTSILGSIMNLGRGSSGHLKGPRSANLGPVSDESHYVAALTTEPPNPSVHTFAGKLTLPPLEPDGPCYDISLDADNVLLRGAVIRNTEWVIGIAFFTGTDTKLVQNSFKTRSKFSQLDKLMNKTVVAILFIMIACIIYLASWAVYTNTAGLETLWYGGLNVDANEKWPYLPNLDAPQWRTKSQNWVQYFFLYVTLLSNFIPLSMYVTVEVVTFCMLWFVYSDLKMYDDTTNTRAVARSTIVSDLGRIEYIFSDKTGTLTQNVMRFKRCSVDGMVFGAPIERSRPEGETPDEEEAPTRFLPLRQLLVGQFKSRKSAGLEGLGGSTTDEDLSTNQTLTFNAEMFLRVMSLCHTVVVEKDIDSKDTIDSSSSVTSQGSKLSFAKSLFGRRRADTNDSLPPLAEEDGSDDEQNGVQVEFNRGRTSTVESLAPGQNPAHMKGPDGAPAGFAYQAESPDEGALVSAASKTFGFQVITRDSSGIKLRSTTPSHLQNTRVREGLKNGSLSLKRLAAETAVELDEDAENQEQSVLDAALLGEPREETWTILAVNKFDSDRKRMSILLRSPHELGSLPILFCKGADSSMLEPEVCVSSSIVAADDDLTAKLASLGRPTSIVDRQRDVSALTTVSEADDNDNENGRVDEDDWEMAQILGLQSHLGDFASEGLRTLVLGMKVLTEDECSSWLAEYQAASTSLKDRSELLTQAATRIERGLHIVGATAIEDKLQKKVPDTIATLAKAGIKLWVLTGDKRETAVEIGYSTCVLTPKMHLTEVPDNGKLHVCTQMSMEFIRLIKMGKLPEYQQAALDNTEQTLRSRMEDCQFVCAKVWRSFKRALLGFFASILLIFGCRRRAQDMVDETKDQLTAEKNRLKPLEKRRRIRMCAEKVIKKWLKSPEGKRRAQSGDEGDDLSLASEETPGVFTRASSAKSLLKDMRSTGRLSSAQLREISMAQLTAHQATEDEAIVDEDVLSMASFFPEDSGDLQGDFDKKKRTILERLFAIDREVRKGKLKKHLRSERLAAIAEKGTAAQQHGHQTHSRSGPRALVIEGAALKHLLGDPDLEGILFAVASNCDAVIACRASPKQKAQLLNLVRQNITPEPITLAIGDGANDVGMIQEAHVGVGISGKEGKQAVNASDFSIAQFRFLEDLVLTHGRWNFFRLSIVVLFSFYKNAVMAGTLIAYASDTIYSGTPLFDEWLIAMLNFVATAPIIALGVFDRCLSKDYVKRNPEVYKATKNNELITFRTLLRWIGLTLIHITVLRYLTVPPQSLGGGMTSGWQGLMASDPPKTIGDGEGGDLKSVGTVTFTVMILILAYKVRSNNGCVSYTDPAVLSHRCHHFRFC